MTCRVLWLGNVSFSYDISTSCQICLCCQAGFLTTKGRISLLGELSRTVTDQATFLMSNLRYLDLLFANNQIVGTIVQCLNEYSQNVIQSSTSVELEGTIFTETAKNRKWLVLVIFLLFSSQLHPLFFRFRCVYYSYNSPSYLLSHKWASVSRTCSDTSFGRSFGFPFCDKPINANTSYSYASYMTIDNFHSEVIFT